MEKPHQAASTIFIDTGEVPEPAGPESVEDKISDLIKGMDPEEVQDLFQAVFAKIPGVEMGDAKKNQSRFTPREQKADQLLASNLKNCKSLFAEYLRMYELPIRQKAANQRNCKV